MGIPADSDAKRNDVKPSSILQAEAGNIDPTSMPNPVPQSTADLPQAALGLASRLFDMARAGDTNTLSQYLNAGIPPNLTNATGATLLMLAAYHGHADTVRHLLSVGADPNILNERGQSPIAGAIFKGWDDVVEVLFRGVEENGNGIVKEGSRADLRAGQPNAIDSAGMFRRDSYLRLFGVEGETSERPWEQSI